MSSQLFPINKLIHIGAGTGNIVPTYQAWKVPIALFVEADPQIYAQLEKKIDKHPNWSCLQTTIAGASGEMPFYLQNNPHEHGLIAAEALTHLWRNIKTVATQTTHTETLAGILGAENTDTNHAHCNWLIVDCLPAAEILAGAGNHLEQMDVVVIRAILTEDAPPQSANKVTTDKLLTSQGFRVIKSIEENHPAIGQILYVRDHKTNVQSQQQLLTSLQQHAQQLATEKGNAEQNNTSLRQQLDALQQHAQQLATEKGHAEQDNTSLRQQLDALQQHAQQLATEKDGINSHIAQLQQELADSRQSKQQLETSHTETVYQCNLLQDEFVKAEAQVELIKELLRRELKEGNGYAIKKA